MSQRHERKTLKINRKHEEFARRLLTDTTVPKWRIYKEVFGSASDNVGTLCAACYQLEGHPAFKAYMDTVKAEIKERFMITIEGQIDKLERVLELSMGGERPQCAAAVQAIMAQAKLAGIDKQVEEEAPPPVQVIIQVKDASIHSDG